MNSIRGIEALGIVFILFLLFPLSQFCSRPPSMRLPLDNSPLKYRGKDLVGPDGKRWKKMRGAFGEGDGCESDSMTGGRIRFSPDCVRHSCLGGTILSLSVLPV